MKYTVLGFQQEKLIDNNLDIKDALILRNVLDRYSSMKMENLIINNERFIWVNWNSFIEDIPIVLKSRKTLEARIKRFVDKELIIREIRHKKDGKGGTFIFIKPTEKLDNLTEYYRPPLKNEGRYPSKIREGIPQKTGNKDSSIRDTSIRDSNKYTQDFENWYLDYPNKFNKAQSFKNWNSTIKKETKENSISKDEVINNILKATDNYKMYLKNKGQTDKNYIVRSTNFLGQRREYKGYLDYQQEANNKTSELLEEWGD